MSGNFQWDGVMIPSESDIDHLFKRHGILYAKTKSGAYEVRLVPNGNSAELVVQNFSDHDAEDNESIYDIQIVKGYIVVILYIFRMVRRIELPSETMHFYLDRLEEKQLRDDKNIPDPLHFLSEEFMEKKSIFLLLGDKDESPHHFRMIGRNWSADCEKERPGVFRIRKIIGRATNKESRIAQFHGHIKFISFDESFTVKGNDYPPVKTNEIFKAWNEYVRFKKDQFDEDVLNKGFLKYSSWKQDGDEIVLVFDNPLARSTLFSQTESEYDIILHEDKDAGRLTDIGSIIEHKKNRSRTHVLYLGKCKNEDNNTTEARFDYPLRDVSIPDSGIIVLSDRSIQNEIRRRSDVMKVIEERSNQTSNMLLRLSAGEGDTQSGSDYDPLTAEVLETMFGDKEYPVKENYREAISIAINTPDLALIQGPPGTGKTTLIKGIVARLKKDGKDGKILISSEQHEALANAIQKVAEIKNRKSDLIPPFVSSKRYKNEENDHSLFEKTVEEFQKGITERCDDILRKTGGQSEYAKHFTNAVCSIQKIKSQRYSPDSLREYMPLLSTAITSMGMFTELQPILLEINLRMTNEPRVTHEEISPERQRIITKIHSQRIDKNVFYEDDGLFQFDGLQRLLSNYGFEDKLYPQEKRDALEIADVAVQGLAFNDYVDYVAKIKQEFCLDRGNDFDVSLSSLDEIFTELSDKIRTLSGKRKKDFYSLVEEFKYRLSDVENVAGIIRTYTNTVGSVCAQVHKIDNYIESSLGHFEYVIIDEAARANPLDLMLPILKGIKVILIGDQMQLPHYIESDLVQKFKGQKERERIGKNYDVDLLQKSLFEVIYESVEKTHAEERLKFKRHVRLNEQHRMHPNIGNFISQCFYNGEIKNGEQTSEKVNNFGLFDSKNVVWIDVPITAGSEERRGTSISRKIEAERIVDTIKNLVEHNTKLNIGVISYYNAQVELIDKMLDGTFPKDAREHIDISCGSVDSFQGKEFDIVFLSTVRCNSEQEPERSLGFIQRSKSRINVSLSRARRLLILVGACETMCRNEYYRNYFDYVQKEGHYET